MTATLTLLNRANGVLHPGRGRNCSYLAFPHALANRFVQTKDPPLLAEFLKNQIDHVSIVYDGQCPVCSRLAAASRLRERTARLDLIDARTESVDLIQDRDLSGVDFDEGFAVVVDGTVHLGADGAHVLAVLTEPSGIFYRLFQWLAGGRRRSRVFYPFLRAGRNLLLIILRIPKFSNTGANREAK